MRTIRVSSWKLSAACAGINNDVFFPASNSKAAAAEALTVCASCPVRADCLQYALDNDIRDGVWGGKLATQRAYMKKDRKGGRRGLAYEDVDHGTDRGAQWHRRHGERPCPECKQAELERSRAKSAERYKRRAAARQMVDA